MIDGSGRSLVAMSESGPTNTDMHDLLREVQDGDFEGVVTALPEKEALVDVAETEDIELEDDSANEENTPAISNVKPPNDSYDIAELLDAGELMARQGDVEEALAAFNRAIALDPTCDMAWFNRGVLLEGNGDTLGARQSFAITLDLNADNGPAAANLATLLDRIGETNEAGQWANVALRTYPGHATLLDVLNRAGITPTSAPVAEEQIQSSPEPQSSSPIVVVEQKELVKSDVEEEVENPVNFGQLVENATALLRSGDADGALSLVNEHLEGAGSGHAGIWRVVAGCRGKGGDTEGAIEAYNKALGIDNKDSKSWHNLGVLHRRSERKDHALTCFSTALKLDGNYVKAADNLRQLALELGNLEMAISAWESLLELEPQHPSSVEFVELLLDLAKGESDILQNDGSIPTTIPQGPELALMALKHIGGQTESALLTARAMTLSGNHIEAVSQWKVLLQNDGENVDYWNGLADALEAAGDLDTAIKCRSKARGFGVSDDDINSANTALAAMSVNEPAPVTENVSLPTEIEQEQSTAQIEISANESTLEEQKTTEVDTETIPTVAEPAAQLEEEEGVDDSQLLLAPVKPVEKEILTEVTPHVDLSAAAAEAVDRMDDAIVTTYSSAGVNNDIEWYNRGLSLISDKKYRESLSCLDKALAVFKDDDEMVIRILNARGNAFYYLEDYSKTIENYHQAMLINPSLVSGRTLYNMGTAYAEMEKFDDAIKCFNQALPRGLTEEEQALAKEQTRLCTKLRRESLRKSL